MRIVWRPAAELSVWHAALAITQGQPLVQPETETRLRQRLAACAAAGAPVEPLLHEQLAGCLKGECQPQPGSPLAAFAAEFGALFPAAAGELALRSGPLVEQWESRGPGLWHALAKRTEAGIRGFEATVHLVTPVCGGGGAVHPDRSVRFETLLTNPHASLPETVRLAWLLARAALTGAESRLDLALVPAVLAAAEVVEWARADEATLTLALTSWRLADPAEAAPLAARLAQWWQAGQPEGWAPAVERLATG